MLTAIMTVLGLVGGWYLHKYYPDLPRRISDAWKKRRG